MRISNRFKTESKYTHKKYFIDFGYCRLNCFCPVFIVINGHQILPFGFEDRGKTGRINVITILNMDFNF